MNNHIPDASCCFSQGSFSRHEIRLRSARSDGIAHPLGFVYTRRISAAGSVGKRAIREVIKQSDLSPIGMPNEVWVR